MSIDRFLHTSITRTRVFKYLEGEGDARIVLLRMPRKVRPVGILEKIVGYSNSSFEFATTVF